MKRRSEVANPRILIPTSKFTSQDRLTEALHAISVFKDPLLVLFHVIEVPSRTTPLDTFPYQSQIDEARKRLEPVAGWLREQRYEVKVKVVVARRTVEGVVEEANTGGYSVVLMLKRRPSTGLAHLFDRLFDRSVTEAVIRSAKCLVMTALVDEESTS